MIVKIALTVDIDREAWNLNFGTGTEAKAVREDVQRYCEGILFDQLSLVDVITPWAMSPFEDGYGRGIRDAAQGWSLGDLSDREPEWKRGYLAAQGVTS